VGGFVGGTLKDNKRKKTNVLTRDLIALDADNIKPGEKDNVLRAVAGLGCAYVVYSTRKHEDYEPRVLKNEKYAGDTMLQKTFVESHLTHKVIENKSELPKGYLENTHPAIIERDIWELAQTKLLKKCKGW
jgi:hypothetical protein